jgi:hypothetical protein
MIFHPEWWIDAASKNPDPFTVVTLADIKAGKWRPVVEPAWSIRYVDHLEKNAQEKFDDLAISLFGWYRWSEPCSALAEAIAWHAAARATTPDFITKRNGS